MTEVQYSSTIKKINKSSSKNQIKDLLKQLTNLQNFTTSIADSFKKLKSCQKIQKDYNHQQRALINEALLYFKKMLKITARIQCLNSLHKKKKLSIYPILTNNLISIANMSDIPNISFQIVRYICTLNKISQVGFNQKGSKIINILTQNQQKIGSSFSFDQNLCWMKIKLPKVNQLDKQSVFLYKNMEISAIQLPRNLLKLHNFICPIDIYNYYIGYSIYLKHYEMYINSIRACITLFYEKINEFKNLGQIIDINALIQNLLTKFSNYPQDNTYYILDYYLQIMQQLHEELSKIKTSQTFKLIMDTLRIAPQHKNKIRIYKKICYFIIRKERFLQLEFEDPNEYEKIAQKLLNIKLNKKKSQSQFEVKSEILRFILALYVRIKVAGDLVNYGDKILQTLKIIAQQYPNFLLEQGMTHFANYIIKQIQEIKINRLMKTIFSSKEFYQILNTKVDILSKWIPIFQIQNTLIKNKAFSISKDQNIFNNIHVTNLYTKALAAWAFYFQHENEKQFILRIQQIFRNSNVLNMEGTSFLFENLMNISFNLFDKGFYSQSTFLIVTMINSDKIVSFQKIFSPQRQVYLNIILQKLSSTIEKNKIFYYSQIIKFLIKKISNYFSLQQYYLHKFQIKQYKDHKLLETIIKVFLLGFIVQSNFTDLQKASINKTLQIFLNHAEQNKKKKWLFYTLERQISKKVSKFFQLKEAQKITCKIIQCDIIFEKYTKYKKYFHSQDENLKAIDYFTFIKQKVKGLISNFSSKKQYNLCIKEAQQLLKLTQYHQFQLLGINQSKYVLHLFQNPQFSKKSFYYQASVILKSIYFSYESLEVNKDLIEQNKFNLQFQLENASIHSRKIVKTIQLFQNFYYEWKKNYLHYDEKNLILSQPFSIQLYQIQTDQNIGDLICYFSIFWVQAKKINYPNKNFIMDLQRIYLSLLNKIDPYCLLTQLAKQMFIFINSQQNGQIFQTLKDEKIRMKVKTFIQKCFLKIPASKSTVIEKIKLFMWTQQINFIQRQSHSWDNLVLIINSYEISAHLRKAINLCSFGILFDNQQSLQRHGNICYQKTDYLLMSNHKSEIDFSINKYLDYLSISITQGDKNQISHRLLSNIIPKLLRKTLEQHQLSEFNKILSLAQIYFIKSRNLKQILIIFWYKIYRGLQLNLNNLFQSLWPLINQQQCNKKWIKQTRKILNSKRRSMSTAINCTKFYKDLQQLNSAIFLDLSFKQLLLKYFCKQFNLQIFKIYQNLDLSNFIDEQNLKILRKKCILRQKIMQSLDFNEISYYIHSIIEIIKKRVRKNFHQCQVYQSLLGQVYNTLYQNKQKFKNEEWIQYNQLLRQLAVLMMETYYQFKRATMKCQYLSIHSSKMAQKIYINISIMRQYDNNFVNLPKNQKYNQNINNQKNITNNKIQLIINHAKNQKDFPISIIYPLGNRIYNLALIQNLLVTSTDRYTFQDTLSTIKIIIKNNSQIVKNKNLAVKDWVEKRARLDRQLGKITNNQQLGIWDSFQNIQLNKIIRYEELNKVYGYNKKQISSYFQGLVQENQLQKLYQYNLDYNKQEKFAQNLKKGNILLFIHQTYNQFPYQNIQSLKKYSGIYRIPSLQYVIQNKDKYYNASFNINNISYLVNTLDNLPDTQKRFREITQKYPLWKGIIGRQPDLSEYENLLKRQIFLYMGHGSGLGRIKQIDFHKINKQCLALIFGCSSGLLTSNSQPTGVVLSYLMNNCPCYLGCLWDVTDKDIDFLTLNLVHTVNNNKKVNLSYSLQKRKKKMAANYLNGSACVLYGLPVFLEKRQAIYTSNYKDNSCRDEQIISFRKIRG